MEMSRIAVQAPPPKPETPPTGGDWRRILPGLLVSLVALAVLFYFVDVQELGRALALADYRYVLLAIGITLLWLLVRAFAWRTLLRDKVSLGTAFFTLNEGYLLNNLLPFRLGEVGRAFLLSRKAPVGFWQVISTIIIERILDLAIAVGLLFATLPFVVGATGAGQLAVSVGLLVLVGLAGLYLLARNRDWAMRMFERVSARLPLLRRMGGGASAFFDGLAVLTDGGRFLRAAGFMLLNWVLGIGQYIMMVRAFFPGAPPLWGAFTLGVAALGVAAPSSPGSVGVFEGAVVFALSVFGQNQSVALALAFVLHLVQIGTTGVLGAMALGRDGESLAGLYRQLRSRGVGAER
jgi:uncharacterized protein (TIRG00374 family)